MNEFYAPFYKLTILLAFICFVLPALAQETATEFDQQIKEFGISEKAARICKKAMRRFHKNRNLVKVLDYLEQERSIREQLPSSPRNDTAICKVYYNLAKISIVLAKYSKALDYSQKAYKATVNLYGENHIESWESLAIKAEILLELERDTDQALLLFQRVVEGIEEQLGYPNLKTVSFRTHIASIYYMHGYAHKAMETYEECLAILDSIKEKKSNNERARIYNNMSAIKSEEKKLTESIGLAQKALDLRREIYGEASANIAYTYHRLATLYHKKEKLHPLVLEYYNKALLIYQAQIGEKHKEVANMYLDIAHYYIIANRLDSATHYNIKSAKLYKELLGTKAIQLAENDYKWALIHEKKGDTTKCLSYIHKCAQRYEEHMGSKNLYLPEVYNHIASLYSKQEKYNLALEHYQKALSANIIGFNHQDLLSLPSLREVQFNTFKKSALLVSITNRIACLYSRYKKTANVRDLQNAFSQIQYLQSLITVFRKRISNDNDKHQLLTIFEEYYEIGLKICWQLYLENPKTIYVEAALNIFEHNKAIYLSDVLQGTAEYESKGIPQELIRKYKSLSIELNYLEQNRLEAYQQNAMDKVAKQQRRIFEISQRLDTIYNFLSKEAKLDQTRANIKLQRIQNQLDTETCIASYYYKNEQLFIIFIKSNKLYFKQLRAKKLLYLLSQYFKALAEQNQNGSLNKLHTQCAQYTTVAYELYQILLGSHFEQKLPKRLMIIPNSWLSYLTFESLITQKPGAECTFKTLDYLVYKTAVSYTYSMRIWQQFQQVPTKTEGEILGFAPDYQNDSKRKALVGTVEEVKFLEQNFKGTYFYAQEATKEQFQKLAPHPRYRVLHLAMHSEPGHQNNLKSHLIFTKDGGKTEEDSSSHLLYTYEIANIPFQVQLVVLSACQTGGGKLVEGEGIMSLARGFVYAQVPNLVMTLWQANDYTSMQLTQSFYNYLAQGLPQDKALQQAKIAYLRNQNTAATHPGYWATFVHFGNRNPIQLISKKANGTYWYYVLSLVGLTLMGVLYFRWKSNYTKIV